MYGNAAQMGSISVYPRYANPAIKPNAISLTITGNKGQQWIRAVVPITDVRPFQFVIEGKVGSGDLADIAIDDVSFSEGCIRDATKPFTTTTSKPINTSKPGTVGPVSGQTDPGIKPTKPANLNSTPDNKKSNSKFY